MHRPTHLLNVQTVRERARKQIEAARRDGDERSGGKALVQLLNQSLVIEIVCALRYRHHYFGARKASSDFAAALFLEHARRAQEHADAIAGHIVHLGGELDFSPDGLPGNDYVHENRGDELLDWIREDLAAKHVAIETYREIARFAHRADGETKELLARILESAEQHAGDMQRWLESANRFVPVERRPAPALRRVATAGLEAAESA